jgi:hypothetical protein
MVKLFMGLFMVLFLGFPNTIFAQQAFCWQFMGFGDVISVFATRVDPEKGLFSLGESFWRGGPFYTLGGGGVGMVNATETEGSISVRFENPTEFFADKDICFLDAQFSIPSLDGTFQFNCIQGPGLLYERYGNFLQVACEASSLTSQANLPFIGIK